VNEEKERKKKMAQHTQLAPLVIGRGRAPAGQQQASQTEAGGGSEQEEMEDQLAPDALAVWSDACRAAGLPASSVRPPPHLFFYLFFYLFDLMALICFYLV
jgi:hypothetical protein